MFVPAATETLGLGVGFLFGAALYLSGLAEPDRIIGTLRLKDFHAMRTIAVFILTSMLGVWVLQQGGLAHMSVKPAAMWLVLIGGSLLGVGFGLSGFCPGTGLACAAAGRLDAVVSVLGMLLGALVFILLYAWIAQPLAGVWDYGKVTLAEITGTSTAVWVWPIVLAGTGLLWITRPQDSR